MNGSAPREGLTRVAGGYPPRGAHSTARPLGGSAAGSRSPSGARELRRPPSASVFNTGGQLPLRPAARAGHVLATRRAALTVAIAAYHINIT